MRRRVHALALVTAFVSPLCGIFFFPSWWFVLAFMLAVLASAATRSHHHCRCCE